MTAQEFQRIAVGIASRELEGQLENVYNGDWELGSVLNAAEGFVIGFFCAAEHFQIASKEVLDLAQPPTLDAVVQYCRKFVTED